MEGNVLSKRKNNCVLIRMANHSPKLGRAPEASAVPIPRRPGSAIYRIQRQLEYPS